MPIEIMQRNFSEAYSANEHVQGSLANAYRNDPEAAMLLERLIDIDEGLQEWRYRHVKMVERTIGMKHGTGGSSGAAYLTSTLFKPIFPDLWAVRSRF
jgi:tryptophan 2,3-dioxygenase